MQLPTTTLAVLATLITDLLAKHTNNLGLRIDKPGVDEPLDLSAKSIAVGWTVDEEGEYAHTPLVEITWKGKEKARNELRDEVVTIYDGPSRNGSNEIVWELDEYVKKSVADKYVMESFGYLTFNFYGNDVVLVQCRGEIRNFRVP